MKCDTKLEWRILSDIDNDDVVTLEAREDDMICFDDSLHVIWSGVYCFVGEDKVVITFMVSHSFVVDDHPTLSGNGYRYNIRKKEVKGD